MGAGVTAVTDTDATAADAQVEGRQYEVPQCHEGGQTGVSGGEEVQGYRDTIAYPLTSE